MECRETKEVNVVVAQLTIILFYLVVEASAGSGDHVVVFCPGISLKRKGQGPLGRRAV